MRILFFLILVALSFNAEASSVTNRYIDGLPLSEVFRLQGVPAEAIQRSFDYLEQTDNPRQYMAIIDYSKPSSEQRFYLMDLQNGSVETFFVAHGRNSGVQYSTQFSNITDSKQSTLGFAITEEAYQGANGRSLRLRGLDKSNSQMHPRAIVLHGADYVSPEYLETYGRMGRSWGCLAVERKAVTRLINALKPGSLIYTYHPQLMTAASEFPYLQTVSDSSIADEPDVDLPGEEEDLQSRK